jgi:glycosyltransferase involved in cell wall biosynthesis
VTKRLALDLRLAGYRGGGIARYGRELARALANRPEIDLRELRSRKDTGGLRLWTPPHHRLERFSMPVELALAGYRPDIYHAIDFIAPYLPRVPVVATVHDLSFVHWPDDLTPDGLRYYRQLGNARRRTAAWITPSSWTADDLAGIYGIDRTTIHVIPHGVSIGLLNERVRPRQERGDYVLAVGTIEPRKRYDLLLAALAESRDLPCIVIAGAAGWNSSGLEARLRTTTGVDWVADPDDGHLRELYAGAIAVVVPSRAEGFGLPALEAMAVGTPVVSSGGGALTEVTADAALTVDEASGAGWSAAIERIAGDDALWNRLSTTGRQRAAGFSWQRAADETLKVYRSLVG